MRVAGAFLFGFALCFILFGLPPSAPAQIPGSGVNVQLPITSGNCVKWINGNTIGDAGTTC